MTVLKPLTELLEVVARHHAGVASALSLREQVAMADFCTASVQMGQSANNNTPSSALVLAREFAANRNEVVYGMEHTVPSLDSQPITVSAFSDTGRTIVHPMLDYQVARFTHAQTIVTTSMRHKPRRRVRAVTVRQTPNNVIHHDFTRKSDLGLVG